jgi:FMN phosphatase YigB (HAD superfamily)
MCEEDGDIVPPAPEDVEVALLDMGNVLADDYWETLVLSPGTGLADVLGVDRQVARRAGVGLWRRYCLETADEDCWWADLASALEVEISRDLVERLHLQVRANPRAADILSSWTEAGLRLGIISDNTSFWYPRQAALVGLEAFIEPDLVFLSFEHGTTKSDDPGLLDVAARFVDPTRTVVVDDRQHNIDGARRRGYHALRYAMTRATP